MRAKEFVVKKDIDEAVPAVLGALGGALLRGAAVGGQALARGAATGVKALGQGVKTFAQQTAASAATTAGQNIANKLTGQTTTSSSQPSVPAQPIQIAPGVKMDQTVSKDPNKLSFKIGDAVFSFDPKDPANNQTMQQLNKIITSK